MKQHMSKLIYLLIILLLTAGCGNNGSSNDGNKTEKPTKKSIIDNADTTYEIVKGSTITINSSKLIDTSKVAKYTWSIDGDEVSDEKELRYDIKEDIGTYKVCLKLTYTDGTTNMSCRDIKVINSKLGKPTVIIRNMPTSGWKTKCPITLDGSQSTAGTGGNIVSYAWFQDGKKIGSDKNQTYIFTTATEHNITLQVTDNENNTNTKTKIVTIQKIGKPTVQLTILSPYRREIFAGQTNTNIPWEPTLASKTQNTPVLSEFLPYEGNTVFLSTHGSFDDCNLTDDNLTYIWDARIYKEGIKEVKNHCFSQKSTKAFLVNVHKDFNTTGNNFNNTYFQTILDSDERSYTHMDAPLPTKVSKEKFEATKYIYPYSDYEVTGKHEGITQHEYIYIELCGGKYLDYDRLEIELTVKDNLHGTQTSITKTIEIKESNSTIEDNES